MATDYYPNAPPQQMAGQTPGPPPPQPYPYPQAPPPQPYPYPHPQAPPPTPSSAPTPQSQPPPTPHPSHAPPPPPPPKRSNDGEPRCMFKRGVGIWLSSVLIVAGLLGIIGTAIGLHAFAHMSGLGAGIWCGLMFIAAGAVGIAAAQSMTVPLVKGTVATAAMAFIFAIVLLIIAIVGLLEDIDEKGKGRCWMLCPKTTTCSCSDESQTATIANVLLIISGAIALNYALWLLILSSRSLRRFFDSQASGGTQSGQQTIGESSTQRQQSISGKQIGPTFTPPGAITVRPDQPIYIVRQHGQPVTTFIHQNHPDGTITLHPDQPVVIVPMPGQPVTHRPRFGQPQEQIPVG